jgi:hypothetical protein
MSSMSVFTSGSDSRSERQASTATVTPIGSRSDRTDHPNTDRAAGNGMMHPSRQAPAGVAASAGLARPARLAGHGGEAVQPGVTRNGPPAAGPGRAEPAFAARADGPPGADATAGADGGVAGLGQPEALARIRLSRRLQKPAHPSQPVAAQADGPGVHPCHPGTRSCSATRASRTSEKSSGEP